MPFADEHLDGGALLARRASPCASARGARSRPALRGAGRCTRGARRAPPCGRRVRSRRPDRRGGRRLRRRHSSRRELGAEHVGRAGGPRRRRMPSSCATSTRRPRSAGSPTASRCTTRWCRRPIDALVDAWFRLGFGHQQVYAIRETPPATRAHRGAAGACRPPCSPRGPGRAREARRRLARAPGAFAGLLAPRVADRRGRPRRVRGGLRRPEIHDVRRRAGRRGDRLCDRVRDRAVVRPQEPCASAGRGLPRLRLGAAGGAGLRRGASARRGGARLGARDRSANGSSPTGA